MILMLVAENAETHDRRILGDATGEMGPFAIAIYGNQNRRISSWHVDESKFVYNSNPWFHRGGTVNIGSDAGMDLFAFSYGCLA